MKEWDHFLKTLLNESEKRVDAPNWIDEERVADMIALKSNLPELYQKAGLDDQSIWKSWSRVNDCENNFPSERRVTHFQQLLIVQALRPDRLQNAMRNFACKLIGLKDISPSSTNIKYIYETETIANEPILIIISPGSDPSQELRELGESVVGKQGYHEVEYHL